VDSVHGRLLHIRQLLERACHEGAVFADAFVLVQTDRGFREGVVVRVADAADGSRQAFEQQCLSESDRGVLDGFRRSLQQEVFDQFDRFPEL
jgi:hypothetical protein